MEKSNLPEIHEPQDREKFSVLSKKCLELRKELKHITDELQKYEKEKEDLWNMIQTYGSHSDPTLPHAASLKHEDKVWRIKGEIKIHENDVSALGIIKWANSASREKPGSFHRDQAFNIFKDTVIKLLGKESIESLTTKQLWKQIDNIAVLYNNDIIVDREVINQKVWNYMLEDESFEFPSLLKDITRKETKTYTLEVEDLDKE